MPLTPIGFLPLIETHLRDYSGTIGVRGDLGGWKVDLSVGRGHNKFDYQVNNTLNTSFGPAKPERFDAGGLRYGQNIVNLDLVAAIIAVGFAKPLSVAAGAEYRHEQFQDPPGRLLQSYAIGPLFRAAIPNTTAANCTTQQGVLQRRRPASAASRAVQRRPARRASRASRPAARPTSTAIAMPPMPNSTPTRSRA